VFSLRGEEAEDTTVAVSGTLLIKRLYALVLFDSGATYSLVNPAFAKKLANKPSEMDVQLYVTTPLGSIYYTDLVFKKKLYCSVGRKSSPCRSSIAKHTRLGCYSGDESVN